MNQMIVAMTVFIVLGLASARLGRWARPLLILTVGIYVSYLYFRVYNTV